MKNITPEWECVHMERYIDDRLKGPNQLPATVYLLHKGHAVSLKDKHLWRIIKDGPPYGEYRCHCNTPIPGVILERWIKMRQFLGIT